VRLLLLQPQQMPAALASFTLRKPGARSAFTHGLKKQEHKDHDDADGQEHTGKQQLVPLILAHWRR